MITLILKNNSIKKFNLKDFVTEKKLNDAWIFMHDDNDLKNKSFKIKTDFGDRFIVKISEIKNCIFEESTYVKGIVK